MSIYVINDYYSDVPLKRIPNTTSVQKFGQATDVDAGNPTDIWDRANTTDAQKVWIPPTQARIHSIVSTSANDSLGGDGAKQITIRGLLNWEDFEVSEVIDMNGTTPVNTVNEYVIVHRMICSNYGNNVGGPNVGTITATAQVDGTVTAQINPAIGTTLMAIYGVPKRQAVLLTTYYGSVVPGGSSAQVQIFPRANTLPETDTNEYIYFHQNSVHTNGANSFQHFFQPYAVGLGPIILKMSAVSEVANSNVSAGFGLILYDGPGGQVQGYL